MEGYIYIIVSKIYDHWSDEDINIEFITPSLDKAKDKFEEFKKNCELHKSNKIHEYSLREYLVEGDYLDYEQLDWWDSTGCENKNE